MRILKKKLQNLKTNCTFLFCKVITAQKITVDKANQQTVFCAQWKIKTI